MGDATEILGWVSSAILLLTICVQVSKQWRAKTSSGVSVWLFIGQFLAQAGFIVYSAMIGSMVFIVTNSLMLLVSVLGIYLTFKFKKS